MTDKPRLVREYQGMQIFDARERILVVLGSNPPRGVRYCLRDAGFEQRGEGVYDSPSSPRQIMLAQSIGNEFYGEKQ